MRSKMSARRVVPDCSAFCASVISWRTATLLIVGVLPPLAGGKAASAGPDPIKLIRTRPDAIAAARCGRAIAAKVELSFFTPVSNRNA